MARFTPGLLMVLVLSPKTNSGHSMVIGCPLVRRPGSSAYLMNIIPRLHEGTRRERVEIHATRQCGSVKDGLTPSRICFRIHQHSHLAAGEVEDRKPE